MSKTKKRTDSLKNTKQLKAFLHCHRAVWKKKSDPVRLAKKTLLELIDEQRVSNKRFDGMNTDPYLVLEDYYSNNDACDIETLLGTQWKHLSIEQIVNTPLIDLFNVDPSDDAWYTKEKSQSRKRIKKNKK